MVQHFGCLLRPSDIQLAKWPQVTDSVRSFYCFFLRLKATKMRFFFKRWLDFETKWGDEQSRCPRSDRSERHQRLTPAISKGMNLLELMASHSAQRNTYQACHIPDWLLTTGRQEGCLKFCCFCHFLPAELCLSMGSEMTFRRWHKAQRFSDRF